MRQILSCLQTSEKLHLTPSSLLHLTKPVTLSVEFSIFTSVKALHSDNLKGASVLTAHLSARDRLGEAPGDMDLEKDESGDQPEQILSEEGLAALIAFQVPFREEMHGYLAVEAARVAKIF